MVNSCPKTTFNFQLHVEFSPILKQFWRVPFSKSQNVLFTAIFHAYHWNIITETTENLSISSTANPFNLQVSFLIHNKNRNYSSTNNMDEELRVLIDPSSNGPIVISIGVPTGAPVTITEASNDDTACSIKTRTPPKKMHNRWATSFESIIYIG